MKEHELDCCVVRDLLPSYIEELTEPETAAQVRAHLEGCSPCREVEAAMRAGLTVERAPKPSLNFLKRVKRTRLIAAILTVILALWCIWWLYDAQAYHYPNTEAGRLEAVEDYVPSAPDSTIQHVVEGDPLRVLGWVEEGKDLYVAYAADNADNVHGILRLERGLNGKYWPVNTSESPFPYTAGIDAQSIGAGNGDGRLFFLMGDGCRDIYSAKVTYGVSLEGSDRFQDYAATYQITEPDFLWRMDFARLEEELGIPAGTMMSIFVEEITLYDKDGRDVTAEYEDPAVEQSWGGGKSTAERFLLYVYIAIVIGLAVVFVRYFLRRD
ncbi:zf-HC2 domain-containing protein [uncultured Flavonifractor sp.]|uniref:zf-HC2 domain-containing protein n=1 Tax=uncultured Flavonifractor sp. TaxID=1193534 RepID=UPI002632107D|nr:zf-HC2 domain-containing protein [uncultured Flavonifractor sp.]